MTLHHESFRGEDYEARPAIERAFLSPTYTFEEKVDIGGGETKYTTEFPTEILDPVPGIILNGYGGPEEAYSPFRHYIAMHGKKPAVTIEPSSKQRVTMYAHPRHFFSPARLPMQGVHAVMEKLEQDYGFEKFDLIGHSKGGYLAMQLAHRYPDKIRSVLLNASAGVEDHNTLSFLTRLPDFALNDLIPTLVHGKLSPEMDERKVIKSGIERLIFGAARFIGEGIDVSNSDVRELIPIVRERGVKIAMLVFPSDRLISAKASERFSGGLVDYFMVYPKPDAGHIEIQIDPEGCALAQLEMLDRLHLAA